LSLILAHKPPEDPVSIERAYWYFLASWMSRNGVAGTARMGYCAAVRWTKNGGSPAVRFRHAVESIPAWHQRLRNVVILRRDGLEICERFEDDEDTAVYVDPPYIASSRSGYGGRSAKYKHEFRHDNPLFGDDHERLRDILAGYKRARIVVS